MARNSESGVALSDGSFDFSGGCDSSRVPTLASALNPNGLKRNQLSWLNNASVRGGGILQRTGWQPLVQVSDGSAVFQGKFTYQPLDGSDGYLIMSIGGHILKVLLNAPYTVTDLSAVFGLFNPATEPYSYFVQGDVFLVIQAGDFGKGGPVIPGTTDAQGNTLPLFWDNGILRRSNGITGNIMGPTISELPAATAMDFFQGHIWYAQGVQVAAGDTINNQASGTVGYGYADSILKTTENPFVLGGDAFPVPTTGGNIRAIKHSANLDATLGEGNLYIFTRKAVYKLTVPLTRADWIALNAANPPLMTVVQLTNGSVNDRSVVAVNGDLYFQSIEPSIRSLIAAIRYFQQPGNVPISRNEQRALQFNDRSLMRFASGIYFDNRLWQAVLPKQLPQGAVHQAVLPLDFDLVSSLEERHNPAWEGAYSGLDFLQLSVGDFGGLERAFGTAVSRVDGSIWVYELTTSSRFEDGDKRVQMRIEFPSFTWAHLGLEHKLKELYSGELWIDKIFGTVDFKIEYRTDADPCPRLWHTAQMCVSRNCTEDINSPCGYPTEPTDFREGFRYTLPFPMPKPVCNSMNVRPSTLGYGFQPIVTITGWCRVRGIVLFALPKEKAMFQGLSCPTSGPTDDLQ